VKQAWKDNRNGQKLYKVELEVKQGSSGVKTKRGVAGKMRDEGLNRKLPGGVVQHEFVDKRAAIKELQVNKITPLE